MRICVMTRFMLLGSREHYGQRAAAEGKPTGCSQRLRVHIGVHRPASAADVVKRGAIEIEALDGTITVARGLALALDHQRRGSPPRRKARGT